MSSNQLNTNKCPQNPTHFTSGCAQKASIACTYKAKTFSNPYKHLLVRQQKTIISPSFFPVLFISPLIIILVFVFPQPSCTSCWQWFRHRTLLNGQSHIECMRQNLFRFGVESVIRSLRQLIALLIVELDSGNPGAPDGSHRRGHNTEHRTNTETTKKNQLHAKGGYPLPQHCQNTILSSASTVGKSLFVRQKLSPCVWTIYKILWNPFLSILNYIAIYGERLIPVVCPSQSQLVWKW